MSQTGNMDCGDGEHKGCLCSVSHKINGSVCRRLVKVRLSFTLNTSVSLSVFTWMGIPVASEMNGGGGISLTLRSGCCRDSRGRDTARYCRLSPKSVKPMREMHPCGPVTFLIKDGDTLKDANKLKQKWKLDDSRFSPPPSATAAAVWQSRVLACTLVQFFHWRERCKKSVHWHERHFINSLKLWRELQGSSSF